MMFTVKTIQKVFAIITFMAVALACHPVLALNGAFTNVPVKELTVVEVNERTGTAILQSPCGETATLFVGDVIGLENSEVTAIRKKGVTLECQQNNPTRNRKAFIPAVQISGELIPVHTVPHKNGQLTERLSRHH